MRAFPSAVALGIALWMSTAGQARSPAPADSAPAWCAPELETLPGETCFFAPKDAAESASSTLVIYLHGVIKPDTTWQFTQQRAMVRHAKVHHFSVIVPRGRRGIGPKDMRDWWTWPTSVRAQALVEEDVIHELVQTKALLEQRNGRPFDRTYVFGFSNGAYYATALALRGKLPVDGYAVMAGGSASYLTRHAQGTKRRPPIYVGYGERDATASRDCQRLGAALRALGWRYRLRGRRNVGHTMTDSQVAEALEFFARSP